MTMLKYNKNKKFKIMQITDIQEVPKISPDTKKLLNAVIEQEKPDLVVLTGDQIKGYGASYKVKGRDTVQALKETLEALLKPVTDAGIPYAVTFGNHDRQVGISNTEQFNRIYKGIGNCIGELSGGVDLGATFSIPIMSSDSGKIVNNIYLFDSGTDAKGGGYEPFSKDIISWYRKERNELKEKNGDYVPSIVFQHIPLCEYYNVLKRVPRHTKNAVRAYRTHKNEYYVLNDTCNSDGIFLEPPSIPNENTGEFEALCECGDIMAVFAGHDHKNSFVGKYKNIDLGFTQSCGFNAYGNRKKRGVRLIELDEQSPNTYRTYTRTFDEAVGDKLHRPVLDLLSSMAPETTDAAIPLIIRAFTFIGIVALAFILLSLL